MKNAVSQRQDSAFQPLVACDLVCSADAVRLLDRVSVSAEHGELIGLVGPNGAGKSSLLRALAGLLPRDRGAVLLEGCDLDRLSAKAIARLVAHVPQVAAKTDGFTALDIVLMGRYPHLSRFQVEGVADRRIALQSMQHTETACFADRSLASLSGGERQRVFVARALAQQPRLLLLDEPTANLDIQHTLKVLDLVRDLVARGLTAIVALHDLALAARYCHRLVLMHQGQVLADGPPEVVLTPANLEVAFGVQAAISRDPLTGTLTLTLLGPGASGRRSGNGVRIHVVCGGGTGAQVICELRRAGFTVTAGALGAGDTDRLAADSLGVAYVPVPAFGVIDDAAHAQHLALVESSHCAILCNLPIGLNNQRNLEALSAARRLVSIEDGPFAQRDFTDGNARNLFDALCPTIRCRTSREAVAAVLEVLARDQDFQVPLTAGNSPAAIEDLREED